MINITLTILIFTILAASGLVIYENCRVLMMFQQNSYRPERYLRWLRTSGDSTSYLRLIGIFLLLLGMAGFNLQRFATITIALFSIYAISTLARRKYKKPLVWTSRAKRMFITMTCVSIIIIGCLLWGSFYNLFGSIEPLYVVVLALLGLYCCSHIILLISQFLMKPIEKSINNRYYNYAKSQIEDMRKKGMKVIGITGSYGKTSTKHYLHRILSEQFETLMTPGSYNTTLGVVRTINEQLKPYHEVFIVEMGAKQKGDIKEICDLVHPSIGIITAVGPQHLETFKSIENVRDTKFELVDSLNGDEALAILNNDYKIIANRDVKNCQDIRYQIHESSTESTLKTVDHENLGYIATNISHNEKGATFTLKCPDGSLIDFETRLFGKYNIANLTAAIAVGLNMGIPIEKIKYSVMHIEPVEHRLSVRRLPSGVIILDDAFNSNPAGASMAVEVLSSLKKSNDSGRKIIITPGMIELGEKQYELNREFGRKIASSDIDIVAIVGEYNKSALEEGLRSQYLDESQENRKEQNQKILFFDSFANANQNLIANANSGDIILIENDLPDTFK